MADITQNFSQLLLTYGPGAMLDLPEHAVVVAGLQDWRYAGSNWRPVEEERLVALLRQQLGAKLVPTFSGLRQPPMFDEERRDQAPGVEVSFFRPGFWSTNLDQNPRRVTKETRPKHLKNSGGSWNFPTLLSQRLASSPTRPMGKK